MKTLIPFLAAAALAASAGAQVEPVAKPAQPAIPAFTFDDLPLPASPFQPDLTPGYVLIEGDIQIPLQQYLLLIAGVPDATFGTVTYWFSGIVPFDFVASGAGAVSPANQADALGAMNTIAVRAGITFRPATAADSNRIRFQSSAFNSSPVGLQGGTQIINIVSWGSPYVIIHELYHSLGFWHEQSRADRGTFVTVNAGNICGASATPGNACHPATCQMCADTFNNFISCAFNFNTQAGTSTYGPYDFDSFMHYGRAAFSCNGGDTITVNAPWNAQWQGALGQLTHFSYYDRIACRAIYPFDTDRWLDRNHVGTVLGTFLLPQNMPNIHTVATSMAPGTLFVKHGNTYTGVGLYTNAVTIEAPDGAVTIGN